MAKSAWLMSPARIISSPSLYSLRSRCPRQFAGPSFRQRPSGSREYLLVPTVFVSVVDSPSAARLAPIGRRQTPARTRRPPFRAAGRAWWPYTMSSLGMVRRARRYVCWRWGCSGSVGRLLTRAVKYATRPMSSQHIRASSRPGRRKTQRPRRSGRGLAPSHRSAWGGKMQQQDRTLGAPSRRFTAVPRSHAAILPPLGSPSIIEIARHVGLALQGR